MKIQILSALFLITCYAAWGQKNPCNTGGVPYTSLPGDTTIILKGGTQVTFNRCEYFDLRDCLEFDEIFDQEAITRAGFTTQDRNGNILISCGMFQIRLTPDCSGKTCFEVPVRVRMPFRVNFSGANAKVDSCALCNTSGVRLFMASSGGTWSDSSNLEYKIIDLGGKKYFEFYSYCANKAYNCDCRHLNATKIKFKAKHGEKLKELTIRTTCPVGVLRFSPKSPRRKMIVKLPCPNRDYNIIVSAEGTGVSGESVQYGPQQLDKMDHGNGKKNCQKIKGRIIRRILGIFPVREGSYYRKYFIK